VENLGEKLLRDVKGPERSAITEALDVRTFGSRLKGGGGYGYDPAHGLGPSSHP